MPVEGVCPTLADFVRGVGRGEEATAGPAHLGQAVAEAVAVAAVRAELAQSHDAGPALGEATGVISLHGGRDQGVEVLRGRQIQGRGTWGGQRHSDREERGRTSRLAAPGGAVPAPCSRGQGNEQTQARASSEPEASRRRAVSTRPSGLS